MITAMMMLFRFNIVNIFRLSCVYLRALLAERRGEGVLWHPGQGRFVALTSGGWEVGWWRAACFSVEGWTGRNELSPRQGGAAQINERLVEFVALRDNNHNEASKLGKKNMEISAKLIYFLFFYYLLDP